LHFVCTYLYRSLFRLYLKQLKKWKIKNGQHATLRFFNFIYAIRKRIVCTRLYLSYFHLYLKEFGDKRDSVFAQSLYNELSQFSRYRNGINGIRKRFVCIRLYLSYLRLYLKGFGDTTRFNFCATLIYSKFNQFSRYRNGTNGIRKRIVCTRLYLSYFRLYLKGFEDTAISKFRKCVKRVRRSFLKIEIKKKDRNDSERRDTNRYKQFSFECHWSHFDILKIG